MPPPTPIPMPGPPKSALGRYRMLAPSAAVRVSPLCLGTMNFGEAWKDYFGACGQSNSEAILDYFYDHGGNFIDTSNNYQDGESEQYIGEWMRKRGNRDQLILATKYTSVFRAGRDEEIMANYGGNGAKSMHVSVEASLKKLQTDYIDLLYVHWWDYATSIPEMMQSLNQLVLAGKVLYLGVSDTPAWVVSKANEYARNHGLRTFSVYQGRWSAAQRDFERDILPMVRDEGMALAPWGVLGGGAFKTEAQRRVAQGGNGRIVAVTPAQETMARVLATIAARKQTLTTSVALAYVLHKAPHVFPIIGGRTVDHLRANIEALRLRLSDEDMAEIESAVPFDIGFPNSFLWDSQAKTPQDIWLMRVGGHFDLMPLAKALPVGDGDE